MKQTARKSVSLLLAAIMVFSLVPMTVFAAEETGTAAWSYNSSNGYYDITTTNMTKTDGDTLWYKDTDTSEIAAWVKENTSFDTLTGISVKYAATKPTVDSEGWVSVTDNISAGAVNNNEVTQFLHNYATTVEIPSLDEFSGKIDTIDSELSNEMTNVSQKNYVAGILNGYYKNVNAQYKIAKDINDNITSYTSYNDITNAYTKLSSAVSTVNSATNSTFKTGVLNYINNVRNRVDEQKDNSGIRSDIESNVLNLFNTFYSKGVAYPLKNVIIDSSNSNIKLIFQNNAGIGSVKKGDLEYWLQHDVLSYILSVESSWRNKTFTVEVSMPTNSETTSATFKYASGYDSKFDKEEMEDLLDSISTNFEYLTFNHTLAYVGTSSYSNDSTGYGTNASPTIIVIADGEFSRSDSDWTGKDTLDFIDWYTYEIAEPIINKTGLNVRILFYDENENLMTAASITASSIGGGSGNATFNKIQNMLNNEFDEYGDLEFKYTVSGTSKTVNVTMKGTNFRENYDLWQDIDRTDFDNWVNKSIVLSVLTYQDSNIRIKLYDKNDKLIDTYEVEYEDVAADKEDVEDYLNDTYYSWNGLYWDFTLKMTDDGTKVVAKGDFKSNDANWKNISSNELQAWAREIAVYVIESIPRNLEIELQNQYGNTLKTFNYTRAGFTDAFEFEKTLNDTNLNYDGYNFTAEVTYSTSTITVKLYSDDFSRNDSNWKSVKASKDFKAWIEENVVSPAIDEFSKGVKVYIYDEDGVQTQTFSYNKSFNGSSSNTNVDDMVKALNKYLGYMDPEASSSNKISATHSGSYVSKDGVVKVKTRLNTTSSSKAWTDKDEFQYNRFISLIMARASWTKKEVELTVIDKNGKTLNTYNSSQYNQEEYKNGVKAYSGQLYDPSGNYIYLSKELYQRSANNYDFNDQVIAYLKDLGSSAKYKILIPISDGQEVKIHMTKSASGAIKNAGYILLLDGKMLNLQIKGSSMSNTEYDISIKPSSINTNVNGIYMPVQYTLTSNKSISVTIGTSSNAKGTIYRYQDNGWVPMSSTSSSGVTGLTFGIGLKEVVFNDISGSNYQDSIRKLAAYGIMNGVGNGAFSPYTQLTRAEAAQLIVNGIAPTTTASGYFADVPSGAWYYTAVMKASNLGIVNGVGNNLFKPDDKVTYDQFLIMLYRVGEALNMNRSDVHSVSTSGINSADWAINNAAYMMGLGVVDQYGYNGNTVVTREIAAELMCNYLVAIGYIA